jgi:SAM-dependent methyltransferase
MRPANVPTKEMFQEFYKQTPPWDIGKPQPRFVKAADQVTGSILDAGCGTGEHALFFAARGHQVTGVDYLEEPIKRAQQKAKDRGIKASFLVKDALALSDLQFDSVIDSGLFHGFSDEERARYVAQLHSVLKQGGKLFMMCFSDREPGTDGPRRIPRQEIEAAFAKGWQIESIEPSQFEIVPIPNMNFSPGGPHAWFAVIKRT